MHNCFQAADILIPGKISMTKWACVACDQYSSQPEYWERVRDFVGDAPSTYHMIFPEALLRQGAGKERIESGMTREVLRCKAAVDAAKQGKTVAVVSSGDAGVYGMASLLLELCEHEPNLEVEVIPGITAACSGGAVLGSPLTCDFACISLSDLLTPWDKIEQRLRGAAAGDFCIALYNPSSRRRADHLARACDILLESVPPETVCGTVRSIGREGESFSLTTLGALRDTPVDMLTTVFVGNSRTVVIDGRMVTPRGYRGV